MNGQIQLHSEKGQGTSFVITMPLAEKVLVEQAESDTVQTDYNKPKVLIVEDNQQISGFIHDLLKKRLYMHDGGERTRRPFLGGFFPA